MPQTSVRATRPPSAPSRRSPGARPRDALVRDREADKLRVCPVGRQGGHQAPYALSRLTREEHRAMSDRAMCDRATSGRALYDRVRRTRGAGGVFVGAFDKLSAG
ncbi:hypothetical protein [Streptomyces gobitricini]|uniref:Uncharacterized protein n=1 Tax=Streptomyces gobitricini TaxID=68211 RepID=A0ABP6ABP9_9ACTN